MLRTLAASARPLLRTGLRFGSSAWANVPLGPPDPILGLTLAFQADQNPQKVNLGVGAYRDDNNKPFIVEAVSKAEKKLHGLDMEYAPIAGVPAFTQEAAKLTFGSNSKSLKDNRVSSLQTLSGTGALRVMGDFLQRFYPGPKKIFLPDPTWANHTPIFKDAGLEVGSYRYYRADDCGFNYEGMLEDLKKIPDNSIVLLHACAHNPTGVDPTPEQWKGILEVMKEKNHYPAIDSAYQGFASGDPTKDAVAVRLFDEAGLGMMVCQSFAKNFGLYGHRVGALHTVCRDADEKNRVDSQLKILVRPMYSNPPIHGARIVAAVLNDQELTQVWERDVRVMADRIKSMRQKLVDELKKAGSSKDWSHILKQIGMFSYTGLNKEQCEKLIKEHHIYLTANGRISMAGITSKNVTYVAQAIHTVTK